MSQQSTQKCWDCQKACGGCSWTGLDAAQRVRFEPVRGWKAKRVLWRGHDSKKPIYTYQIDDCPEFEAAPKVQKAPPAKTSEPPKGVDRSPLCAACSVYTRMVCQGGRAACRAVLRGG